MLDAGAYLQVFNEAKALKDTKGRFSHVARLFFALVWVRYEHPTPECGTEVFIATVEDPPTAPTHLADILLLALEFCALNGDRPKVPHTILKSATARLQLLMDQHPLVRRKLVALGAPDWKQVMDRVAGDTVPAWQRSAVARWLSEGKTVEQVFEHPSMSGIPWHRRSALRIQEELRAEQEGGAPRAC